jgi:hypothetical protein
VKLCFFVRRSRPILHQAINLYVELSELLVQRFANLCYSKTRKLGWDSNGTSMGPRSSLSKMQVEYASLQAMRVSLRKLRGILPDQYRRLLKRIRLFSLPSHDVMYCTVNRALMRVEKRADEKNVR